MNYEILNQETPEGENASPSTEGEPTSVMDDGDGGDAAAPSEDTPATESTMDDEGGEEKSDGDDSSQEKSDGDDSPSN